MNNYGMKRMLTLCLTIAMIASLAIPLLPSASAAVDTTWTIETPMVRDQAQALVAADSENGNVYVLGGAAGVDVGISYKATIPIVLVYDVETGDSMRVADMPKGVRAASGGMGHDGKIYVFGGYNDSLGTIGDTQIYDIATDTWTTGAAMPSARSFTACAMNWPFFYIMGGNIFSTTVDVYNAESDSWGGGVAMPVDRWSGSAVYCPDDDSIFYIGGTDFWNTATNTVLRYDLALPSWSYKTTMPVALDGAGAVLGMDGMIYVAGGSDQAWNVLGTVYDDAYYYCPLNDTWSTLPSLNEAKKYLCLASMQDGQIIAFGGNNKTMTNSTVESMRPVEATTSMSSTTISQGSSAQLNLRVDTAFATPVEAYLSYYLISDANVGYPWVSQYFMSGNASTSVVISETMPAGSYELHAFWYVNFETGQWAVPEAVIDVTIQATTPTAQRISDLKDKTIALQDQLDSAQDDIAALQDENALMHQDLTNLSAQLNSTKSDLNNAINNAGNAASNANEAANSAVTYSMLGMIVAIIILLLVLVSMFMPRKGKPVA